MFQALEAIRNGSCGYLKAAKQFGVPKSTLERRFKEKNKYATGHFKTLGSRKLTFPIELEQQLVDYVKNMEGMLFGLTTRSLRSLAYQLATKNHLAHHFNDTQKMAGWDWLRSFLKRNKLSLRLPEATSAVRARGFNKESVSSFFNILEPLKEKFNFPPSRVFNVDETGITTVQGRPSKVVALRGQKQVGTLTSSERGELSTAVICMSASGIFVPPMLIIPRVRMKSQFLEGVPPGTLTVAHKSGWMQLDLFDNWFDHFLIHTQASKNNPTLLILDGHKTHTQNISVIDKARENGVTILCLPPHCTHRMQPLDVSFMSPLNTFYTQEMEIWLRNHPGRCVTVNEVPSLFGKAYLRATTPTNAINGFEKTGLYPVNRTVFTDDMFVAAVPTDRPHQQDDAVHPSSSSKEDVSEESVIKRDSAPEKQIIPKHPESTKRSDLHNVPSTSRALNYINPEQIAPFPKVSKIQVRKTTKIKRGKAAILTSSPYKEELEISLKEKKPVNVKEIASGTNICSKDKSKKTTNSKERKFKKGKSNNKSKREKDDVECLYCNNKYSSDRSGEEWIKCCNCKNWAHEACAGIEPNQHYFICDLCRDS